MRKVILYMALSLDGFIADTNDETPWSDEEWLAFENFARSCDVCIVGRKTYDIIASADDGIVKNVNYLIATNSGVNSSNGHDTVTIKALSDLPECEKIGIIGGGDLNGALATLNAFDEIILDIEPVILGDGKRLFGDHNISLNVELLLTQRIGKSTVQNHYKVVK